MAIRRGHFAVTLSSPLRTMWTPTPFAPSSRKPAVDTVETVSFTEVPALATAPAEPSHAITVYGADHPGIVHAVTKALAESSINIVGLTTRVAGDIYAMLLEIACRPPRRGRSRGGVSTVGAEQGVDFSIRAIDADGPVMPPRPSPSELRIPGSGRRAAPVDPRRSRPGPPVAADLVDTMRSHPRCVGLAARRSVDLVQFVAIDVNGHPKAEAAPVSRCS